MPHDLGVPEEIRVLLLGTDGQPDLYELLNEILVERDLVLVDLCAEGFEGHEPFAHSDQHLDLIDTIMMWRSRTRPGGDLPKPACRKAFQG
jgi:hypothetical protein